MTEDEHIKLTEVGDSFWDQLGVLVASHIAMMPEELEFETIEYLQNYCSIYGTNYGKYLKKFRLDKEK